MRSSFDRFIHWIVLGGDLLLITISYLISYYIESHILHNLNNSQLFRLFSITFIGWTFVYIILDPDKENRFNSVGQTVFKTAKPLLFNLIVVFAVIGFAFDNEFDTSYILNHYLAIIVLIASYRIGLVYSLRVYRHKGFNYKRIVLVGYNTSTTWLEKYFTSHPSMGIRLLGYFDKQEVNSINNWLGTYEQLPAYVLENGIDEIYCDSKFISTSELNTLTTFCEKNQVALKLMPESTSFRAKEFQIEFLDNIPLINVQTTHPLDYFENRLMKRIFDIVFSSIVILCILSWLLPILAILIKLDNPGPVFFKQKRTGLNNKDFQCYKLRSMKKNNDAHLKQATKNDSRITRMGAFMRKTNLDELPQFFNVFLGDMSVVGPRPHMLKHTEMYAPLIEGYMERHKIKPGITGLSQVEGYRGETMTTSMMRNRVKVDLLYMKKWSFWLDMRIIYLTVVKSVVTDKMAY